MSRFTGEIKKFIFVICFMLCLFKFMGDVCFAQETKQVPPENRLTKNKALLTQIDALSTQMDNILSLQKDVADILKNTGDRGEKEFVLLLLDAMENTYLRLDTRYQVLILYNAMLYDCSCNHSNKLTVGYVRKLLDIKESLERNLETANFVLSSTKKPGLVLQCDKFKTEVRNTMDVLDQAKKFFE